MLSLPESSRLEYKRDYSDNIRRCVIAFANSDGGKIYVGIEDDGRVCCASATPYAIPLFPT